MNCSHCISALDDYLDGAHSAETTRAIESHLADCAGCRSRLQALRSLQLAATALPRELAPARDLWPDLKSKLVEPDVPIGLGSIATSSKPSALETARSTWSWLIPFAVAASIVLLAAFGGRHAPVRRGAAGWAIASVSGAPRLDARALRGEGQFRVGQWLETDAASRARVAVGAIGEVNVEPNSRLRLVGAAATDHRLELSRGTLHALIWAPPRLFFVDTPSATAVDLGCSYTLTVDDAGGGTLHVTSGYVALEHAGRESIIPWRAMCHTRRGAGPGTPFAEDAPEPLRAALERFDFGGDTSDPTLRTILAHARAEDAVTLWHLLARTNDRDQRAAVFDTLARQHRPPDGVTRAGIVAGDAAMRTTWATELGIIAFGLE